MNDKNKEEKMPSLDDLEKLEADVKPKIDPVEAVVLQQQQMVDLYEKEKNKDMQMRKDDLQIKRDKLEVLKEIR